MLMQNDLNTWRLRWQRARGNPGYVTRELKNRFRQLHFVDYRLRPSGAAFKPDFFTFVLTYRCNLRCKHCFLYDAETKKNTLLPFTFSQEEELSLDQWKGIVDDVASFRPHIQLVGGEVFIYRGVMELIRHIKAKGLTCAINTNGYFTAALAEELVDAGVDWLTLSVDGPKDAHTAMRLNKHSFDRVMETVRAVRAARHRLGRHSPILSFNTVITDLTYTRQTEMVRLAEDVGVDQLEFQGLMFSSPEIERAQEEVMARLFGRPATSAEGFENKLSMHLDTHRLAEELDRVSQMNTRIPIRLHPSGLVQDVHGYHDLNHRFRRRCTAPWRELQILPNGDVSACWGLPEITVGNVARDGFAAVWNGEKMRDFRRKLRQEGLFPACVRCCRRDY